MQTKNVQFGSGVLYGVPNAGDTAANPTPQQAGILQSVSLDFKGDLKELFGRDQYSVKTARGKISISGKASFASVDPNTLNQLALGQVKTSGIKTMSVDESEVIPGTPFQVTVTHAADFQNDFGVRDGDTGVQLEKVASAPATGQYSVVETTGVYTFAAADTAKTVLISYSYALTTGSTVTISNKRMGKAPAFRMFLFNDFDGEIFGVDLNSVRIEGWSLPTKQEDFWMIDISFKANADASGVVGKIYHA